MTLNIFSGGRAKIVCILLEMFFHNYEEGKLVEKAVEYCLFGTSISRVSRLEKVGV